MASAGTIIARWVEQVGTENPRFLRPSRANVHVDRYDGNVIYSYGHHFELARLIGGREKGFFLINSTKYSVSTSQHQSCISQKCKSTGIPTILLPYASLRAAGIDQATIVPIEILDDTWIKEDHSAARLAEVPERHQTKWNGSDYVDIELEYDGRYHWTTERHQAGRSIFEATYDEGGRHHNGTERRGWFISSFDDQEKHQHYFLAQLPDKSYPVNFKDGVQLLRPDEVLAADARGLAVVRQGDIFAIPTELTTRELHKPGWSTIKQGRLLATSHVASQVIVAPGGPFARGILYHRPERLTGWGRPDPTHARQKLGDGKTWHKIIKNTVPQDRSWSLVGQID